VGMEISSGLERGKDTTLRLRRYVNAG